MEDLLAWLKEQNGGIGTYFGLQQRAQKFVATDPEHAAVFQLLSNLAGRFASSYEDEPLPVDVAQSALARITELVEQAALSTNSPPEDRLRILNQIASTDLITLRHLPTMNLSRKLN